MVLRREAGFSAEKVQEFSHWQTIAQQVAAGVGIALQKGDTLLLKSYGVVYSAVDNPEAGRVLAVARRNDAHSPVVEDEDERLRD